LQGSSSPSRVTSPPSAEYSSSGRPPKLQLPAARLAASFAPYSPYGSTPAVSMRHRHDIGGQALR
jgi:hypothetical protein